MPEGQFYPNGLTSPVFSFVQIDCCVQHRDLVTSNKLASDNKTVCPHGRNYNPSLGQNGDTGFF